MHTEPPLEAHKIIFQAELFFKGIGYIDLEHVSVARKSVLE
jgi:hypothetical protein